jgi:streptomycin 6-kinase
MTSPRVPDGTADDQPHGQPDDQPVGPIVPVPRSFVDMPRWWTDGKQWLTDLPSLISAQCAAWRLRVVGEPAHGSNALVVPVARDGERFALRLTPPGADVAAEVRALRFWDGRGMVRLVDDQIDKGALLLEWLPGDSLRSVPVDEAVAVLGATMRRLAVPAPIDVPSTREIVTTRAYGLERDWSRLGDVRATEPFDAAILTEAMVAAERLIGASPESAMRAVDGDLHSDQVLRASREPWLAIDPVLLRGDIDYDLARILWTRLDEMADDTEIRRHFATAVRAAGLNADHARDMVLFRTVDYWLWGLDAGLTEDPLRCRRLVGAFG